MAHLSPCRCAALGSRLWRRGQDAGDISQHGYRAVGLDRTSSLLPAGQRRYRSLPLVRADLRQLPFQAMSFNGLRAAASLMHLPKAVPRGILTDLSRLIPPGGLFAATVIYGVKSRIVTEGGFPDAISLAGERRNLLVRFVEPDGTFLKLRVITNRERKGRWLQTCSETEVSGLPGLLG